MRLSLLRPSRVRALALSCLAIPQAACGAGWRQPIEPISAILRDSRQQVQVWHAGRPLQLHGVTISAESLHGVLYHRPLECDSCRIGLARSEVDSLRTGSPPAGLWRSTGLIVGLLFAFAVISCTRAPSCNFTD